MLTKPGHRDVCVAGVHARFHFERRSGTLLLVASNLRGSAVVLNGQSYSHDIRVVGRRSNTIEFGDLAYRLEFVIRSPSQEVRYQRDLRGYLETIYGTQPVPSLLATPSAHDRELGDYIFRSTLAKGGSCVVSVANHAKTGAPAAVKELLRMKRNYKRVDQEIEIAKSLNHVGIKPPLHHSNQLIGS